MTERIPVGTAFYSVAGTHDPIELIGGLDRYVIVEPDSGRPFLVHRSNGQTFYSTYRTERGAHACVADLLSHGAESAAVFDKWEGR